MKNIRIAVVTVGAVAALVALAGCGSSKTHGAEGTLKLTEPAGGAGKTFGIIGKASEKSVSAGSGYAFSTPLQSEKKTVGEINAECIATQPSSGESLNGTCSATATVPGGTFALSLGGKSVGGKTGKSGAIVGGTGKYNGAVGNFVTSSGSENSPSPVTFNYILP